MALFVSLPFSISLTLSLPPHVVLVFHRMRSRCFFEVQEEREQRTGRGGGGGVNVQSFSIHKEEEKIVGVENRREILEYGAKVCEDGRLGALNP